MSACSRSDAERAGNTASAPLPTAQVSSGSSARPAIPTAAATVPAPPVRAGSMAPRLRAAGSELWMTWIEPSDVAPAGAGRRARSHRVRFARYAAGRWSEASTIAEGAAVVANWADAPSVSRGGDGAWIASWAEKSGSKAYAYDVMLARSTDGRNWRRLGRAHDDGTTTEHGFVSLLPEGAGVRAFWLDGRETATTTKTGERGAMTLRTALVGPGGVTGSEILDPRVCDCCGTAAASTRGGPRVVYRDRRDGEIRDISTIGRAHGQWSEPQPVHADGWSVPGCPVNGPMVVADGDRVAVAWYTYVERRSLVRLALSRDAGRTFSGPIEVDGPVARRAPIGRVDVVLDGDGAIVGWLASERDEASLLVARVAGDGRAGEPLAVARTSAARDSGFPQLERLGETLVLAWTRSAPARVELGTLRPSDLPAPGAARRGSSQETSGLLAAGSRAPDYQAKALDGRPASLASLRGEVVLLNVWASWCEPCRRELGELAKLHQRYARKGLRVVAVSVDGVEIAAEIDKLAKRQKLPYAMWHDPRDRASSLFGVGSIPASFVIDRDGVIAWSQSGALTAADEGLGRALDTALKRPRPTPAPPP